MKKYIVLPILALLFLQTVSAQINTGYLMRGFPQPLFQNPAIQPSCKFYMTLWGAEIKANHTGFGFYDLFDRQGDTLYFTNDGLDYLSDHLKKRNDITLKANVPIFGFGFRNKTAYISFGIESSSSARFSYPGQIVDLLRYGNFDYDADKVIPIDLSGLETQAISYLSIGITYSKQVNNNLTLGGRIRYLMGNTAVNTYRSNLQINTDQNTRDMTFEGNYEIRSSLPLVFEYDSEGNVENADLPEDIDYVDEFLLNGDRGFALDLGATYKLNDRINFFASLTDLGYIKWHDGVVLKADANFEFKGIDFTDYIVDSEQNTDNLGEELIDSIMNSAEVTTDELYFTTRLSPYFTLGGTFDVTKKINVGGILRTQFFDGRVHPQLTLSANMLPVRWFSLSLSYSMMNYSYNNIGLGFAIKLGPLQLYIINDNLTAALNPLQARGVNMHLGMNLLFGCRQKVDLPSYEE